MPLQLREIRELWFKRLIRGSCHIINQNSKYRRTEKNPLNPTFLRFTVRCPLLEPLQPLNWGSQQSQESEEENTKWQIKKPLHSGACWDCCLPSAVIQLVIKVSALTISFYRWWKMHVATCALSSVTRWAQHDTLLLKDKHADYSAEDGKHVSISTNPLLNKKNFKLCNCQVCVMIQPFVKSKEMHTLEKGQWNKS